MSNDISNQQITVKDIKYINLEDSTFVYITDQKGYVKRMQGVYKYHMDIHKMYKKI